MTRRSRAPARSRRARAAQAMGRADEASANHPRAMARRPLRSAGGGASSLREFGSSLAKADHVHRADRLLYAGYLSAGARAAVLAGPDVLGASSSSDRERRARPMSPWAHQGGSVGIAQRPRSPVLKNPVRPGAPGASTKAGGPAEPRALTNRGALVNPDRWWSERKMVAPHAARPSTSSRLAFEVCDQTVQPDSSEAQVDAAFHAGWIALRFLNDAPSAAKRFALAARGRRENPLSRCARCLLAGPSRRGHGRFRSGQDFLHARRERADRLLRATRRATSSVRPVSPSVRPPAAAEGDRRDEAVRVVQALYIDGLDDLAAALAFDTARQWRDESQLAAMGRGGEAARGYGDSGSIRQDRRHARAILWKRWPFRPSACRLSCRSRAPQTCPPSMRLRGRKANSSGMRIQGLARKG